MDLADLTHTMWSGGDSHSELNSVFVLFQVEGLMDTRGDRRNCREVETDRTCWYAGQFVLKPQGGAVDNSMKSLCSQWVLHISKTRTIHPSFTVSISLA